MEQILKMQEFIEKYTTLIAPIVKQERITENDFQTTLHYQFLNRFYYNSIAVKDLLGLLDSDRYFIFPIALLLRTSMLDYITYLYLVQKILDPNIIDKENEIRSFFVDSIERLEKDIKGRVKRNEMSKSESEQANIDLRTQYAEYYNPLTKKLIQNKTISPREIIDSLKTLNEIVGKESMNAYNSYILLSKYEHVGAFTKMLYLTHKWDSKFDIGGILHCVIHMHYAIRLIYRNIGGDEDFDSEIGDCVKVL